MLKSKATDWEKILAIHISDKGLVSKIYEVPFTLHSKKKKYLLTIGKTFDQEKIYGWKTIT